MKKVVLTLLVLGAIGYFVLRKVDEGRPPVLGEVAAWETIGRELFGRPASRDWTALRWHRDRKGERPTHAGWEYRLERRGLGQDPARDVLVGPPFEMESVDGEFVLVARHSSLFDYLWEKVSNR